MPILDGSRDRVGKRFLFREGLPIFAESNLASESLGIQLMDAGKLDRAGYKRLSAHVEQEKCKEGKALLDLGLLDAKGLFLALKDQVRSRLLECFGWPHGEFYVDRGSEPPADAQASPAEAKHTGTKTAKIYREPIDYAEVLKAAGANLDPAEVTARYYRERAIPHLIAFPIRKLPRATDPLPENLEVWDVASPLEQIDWLGTLLSGPHVIPGVTTRERQFGTSPGADPESVLNAAFITADVGKLYLVMSRSLGRATEH